MLSISYSSQIRKLGPEGLSNLPDVTPQGSKPRQHSYRAHVYTCYTKWNLRTTPDARSDQSASVLGTAPSSVCLMLKNASNSPVR